MSSKPFVCGGEVGRQKFCNSFLSQKCLDAMPALRHACCGVSARTQAAASAARASMEAACRLAATNRLSSRQSLYGAV